MSTPQRPGWYPAPDGSRTEQWWNGAAWSDTKRGVGGAAMPGLPGYQAAPPVAPPTSAAPDVPRPDPYAPPVGAPALQRVVGSGGSVNLTNSTAVLAFVFSMLGIFIFGPLAVVGIVLGIIAVRRPTTVGGQRAMAIAAIVAGFVALAIGAVQLLLIALAFMGQPS
jgi:hypothetical protein